MEDGLKVGQWEVAASVAGPLLGIDARDLETTARSEAILDRIRKSTRAFFDLQVTQRPTFVIRDEIDDRAVFSGLMLTVASPRSGSMPHTTSATTLMAIGRSFTLLITVLAMSASLAISLANGMRRHGHGRSIDMSADA